MDVFREGKFEFITLIKGKLKVNGEVSWHSIKGLITSVQEMESVMEGVAIMLNNV